MECCGALRQNRVEVMTVPVGATTVVLERCAHCDSQRWLSGTAEVSRDEAFSLLARAYREIPLRAHAARDRAHVASAARRTARVAHRESIALPPSRETTELRELLSGWQVLGAAS